MDCKIGLVSFSSKHDNYILLGICKYKISLLNNIYSNIRYLTSFKVIFKTNEYLPDNIEELKSFCNKYKIKQIFTFKNDDIENNSIYRAPILYDLTCNVPVFSNYSKKIYNFLNTFNNICMFIILPYNDPIIKGKIINNCIEALKYDEKPIFYVIGKKIGKNKKNTCELTKRQLLSIGIKSEDILKHEGNDFPEYIFEAIDMVKIILTYSRLRIFIGVSTNDIQNLSKNNRMMRREGILTERIRFICD